MNNNLKPLNYLKYECKIKNIPLENDIPYKCASCDFVLYTDYHHNFKRCLTCWGKINHVKNNMKEYSIIQDIMTKYLFKEI